MFKVGETYKNLLGNDVKIVDEKMVGTDSHHVQGDDGAWRYATRGDMGRTTGTSFDMSYHKNLIPFDGISPEEHIKRLQLHANEMHAVLQKLTKYFTSGNEVPVSQANIKAKDFWDIVYPVGYHPDR